jgi:L-rhamnose mutarotase
VIRYAFRIRLKPGTGEEYARLHDDVDQEVLEGIRRAGVHNYSIFLDAEDVFGYMEIEDLDRFAAEMRHSDPSRPWARAVINLFAQRDIDESVGFPRRLREVFRFD